MYTKNVNEHPPLRRASFNVQVERSTGGRISQPPSAPAPLATTTIGLRPEVIPSRVRARVCKAFGAHIPLGTQRYSVTSTRHNFGNS
jgi:hypothetical protein